MYAPPCPQQHRPAFGAQLRRQGQGRCVPKMPHPKPELCRVSPSPEPGAWTQQVLSWCLHSEENLNPSSQPSNEELGESTPSKARTSLCLSEWGQHPSCPGQRVLVAGDMLVAKGRGAWDSGAHPRQHPVLGGATLHHQCLQHLLDALPADGTIQTPPPAAGGCGGEGSACPCPCPRLGGHLLGH